MLAGADMVQELHRHDFFFILALKKGAGNHEIDFTSYKVCDHAVYFMRPGQVHRLTLKAGSTGYLMQFNTDFYFPQDKTSNQLLRETGKLNFYHPDAGQFKKLLAILTHIFQEYTGKPERFQEVIQANLSILFIGLLRQHRSRHSNPVTPYTQERLEAFLELLEKHLATHKQVSQYANMLNLTPYQLNAITKATLGKPCSKIITEYNILEAKRNLLAGSSQVNQIADLLGYEDVSYFIRFFKKQTGYTPEIFRQNFR